MGARTHVVRTAVLVNYLCISYTNIVIVKKNIVWETYTLQVKCNTFLICSGVEQVRAIICLAKTYLNSQIFAVSGALRSAKTANTKRFRYTT